MSQKIQLIEVPTLVIIDDHEIVRPEHVVSLFRLIPNTQLALLPDTDHMSIVKRSNWLSR